MKELKLVSLEKRLADRWLNYYEATYRDSQQNTIPYHFVSRAADLTTENLKQPEVTASAVAMFCLNPTHDKVLLLKQFRLPVNDVLYGNPSGLVDANESVEQAIKRELHEETGYRLASIEQIFKPSYSTPGITDAALILAIVTLDDTQRDPVQLEKAEAIDPIWIDKAQGQQILDSGKLSGRTQLLLWQWINQA